MQKAIYFRVKVKTMTLALTLTWCGTMTVFMAIILASLFLLGNLTAAVWILRTWQTMEAWIP